MEEEGQILAVRTFIFTVFFTELCPSFEHTEDKLV